MTSSSVFTTTTINENSMSNPLGHIQHLDPERYRNNCGGCGRPVPAPCPYCQTCHCSLNCSLLTAGKSSKTGSWIKDNKNRWFEIVAISLCVLLVLVIIALVVCVWYFSDRWTVNKDDGDVGASGDGVERRQRKKSAGSGYSNTIPTNYDYNDYHYFP